MLAKKYELHPTQINASKKEFLTHSAAVFEKEGSTQGDGKEQLIRGLYDRIDE